MSPLQLAERRAIYAAIDDSGDNHLRPALIDPMVHHGPRSTAGMSLDYLWWRERSTTGPAWRITTVVVPVEDARHAVVDNFGDLVEVPR